MHISEYGVEVARHTPRGNRELLRAAGALAMVSDYIDRRSQLAVRGQRPLELGELLGLLGDALLAVAQVAAATGVDLGAAAKISLEVLRESVGD